MYVRPTHHRIDDTLFQVFTPLGFRVRVGRRQWDLIVTVKHPPTRDREAVVRETLAHPAEVRLSQQDAAVYLFYRTAGFGRWVCAVARRLDTDGFLITAYVTDAIKEGQQIWRR